MMFCHLVCFPPLVGFQPFDRFSVTGWVCCQRWGFCQLTEFLPLRELLPLVGFLTLMGFPPLMGFLPLGGLSAREDLYHWWDFSGLEDFTTVGGFSALMKQTKKRGINTQSLGVVIHSEVART